MSTVVRISDHLADEAKTRSKVEHRSMTSQVEYWATIGKAAEENPDLPFSFIKETLLAMEEMKKGQKEEYTFG
ncbi:ParD-like family protein [Puniceicoccus vermicola]|uniref:ParD-like family protein n=1 Tax=Puniceicoccus vermicola TaxID=388746 RepID=A0A7X1E6Q8_9BACT|nr:ParD-like family protein [Puniceicoccus vermicola]MBC2604386.1 ParD-like family protein [Puniceicoccus vermicola]